jgi:hypothetical protein
MLSLRGRQGIQTRLAREDWAEMTLAARTAARARFRAQVDPENRLSATERERRANAAQRAHMAKLTMLSITARRSRSNRRHPAKASSDGIEIHGFRPPPAEAI